MAGQTISRRPLRRLRARGSGRSRCQSDSNIHTLSLPVSISATTMMTTMLLLMMPLLMPCATRRGPGRRTSVQELRCWCGKNTTKAFGVNYLSDKSVCTDILRGQTRDIKRKGEGQYPLKAKMRRDEHGQQVIVFTWDIRTSRRKRTTLNEFHLLFTRTLKKNKSKARTKRRTSSQCFTVKPEPGQQKMCRTRVTCQATYVRKRLRRMNIHLSYRSANERRRRRSQKFNVLKASVRQQRKRKAPKSRKARSRKLRRGLCEDWRPKNVNVHSEDTTVFVEYSPLNPFRSEVQVILQNGPGSLETMPPKFIPANENRTTFTDVKAGKYNVLFRLIDNCEDAVFFKLDTSVTVKDGKKGNVITSCTKWQPKVMLRATSSGHVEVFYTPVNPFADEVEVVLREPGGLNGIYREFLTKDTTKCTFRDVDSGTYQVSFRPHGPQCNNVVYLQPSNSIVTVAGPPPCSNWRPLVNTSGHVFGDYTLVIVSITPPNDNASEIGVALEEDKHVTQERIIGARETKVIFNISANIMGKTLKALVRPFGCRDCKDWHLHREPCWPSFITSDVIKIEVESDKQGVKSDLRPAATRSNPEYSNDSPVSRTTFTPPENTTMRESPQTVHPNPEEPPNLKQVILLSCLTAAIVVASAAGVAWCLRGKLCKKNHDIPVIPSEGEPLNHDPENPCPDPDEGRINQERERSLEAFPEEYERINRTEPKSVVSSSFHFQQTKQVIFLVHVTETEHRLKEIVRLFAGVIRALSVDITVKLDFECQIENRKNVTEWAEKMLQVCTNVVIVLSENFLKTCKSYLGSKSMEVRSGCPYSDIAPKVMKTLTSGMGFRRATFVHFGLENAEHIYQELLSLYHSLHTHPWKIERSPAIEIGQPVSEPPLPCPPVSDVPVVEQASGSDPGISGGRPDVEVSHLHGVSAALSDAGRCCIPDQRAEQACLCQNQGSTRQRHQSAPKGGSPFHCQCHSDRGRHHSAPEQQSRFSDQPPSYNKLYPPDRPAFCQTSEDSVPSYSPRSADADPQCSQHCSFSESLPNSPPVPPQDSIGVQGQCPVPSGHHGPKLISLLREQDLKDFFRMLGHSEQTKDKVLASSLVKELFHAIEKRLNDENSREPVQHSCFSSRAVSDEHVNEDF